MFVWETVYYLKHPIFLFSVMFLTTAFVFCVLAHMATNYFLSHSPIITYLSEIVLRPTIFSKQDQDDTETQNGCLPTTILATVTKKFDSELHWWTLDTSSAAAGLHLNLHTFCPFKPSVMHPTRG